jgi:hypothetical protein
MDRIRPKDFILPILFLSFYPDPFKMIAWGYNIQNIYSIHKE